jgi:hypothetical protein
MIDQLRELSGRLFKLFGSSVKACLLEFGSLVITIAASAGCDSARAVVLSLDPASHRTALMMKKRPAFLQGQGAKLTF